MLHPEHSHIDTKDSDDLEFEQGNAHLSANRLLFDVAALLLSIFLLLVGNGLLGTLLGIRAGIEQFNATTFGIIMSSYFVGYIIGALYIPSLVERVGHIRIFAILASASSITAILHGYFIDPAAWIILRFLTGISLCGLYLVVESWLNGKSSSRNRGKVFSIYMALNLGALAIGQQFLNVDTPTTSGLFIISSVLFSLAVIPVGLTKAAAPAPIPTPRMRIKRLYSISPLGVVGTFATGLSNGAFWGIIGAYCYDIGMTTSQIATFITCIVLGGMTLQTPIGWASDKIDRRIFIVGISSVIVALSLVLMVMGLENLNLLYAIAFLFGGMLLTVNAVCTAHVNDHIKRASVLQVSGTLLLIFGMGAALGPTLVSITMGLLGSWAFYLYIAVIQSTILVFAAYRRVSAGPFNPRHRFVPGSPSMPRMTTFGAKSVNKEDYDIQP